MLTSPHRTKIGDLKISRWINAFGFLLSMALLTGVLVSYVRDGWSANFGTEAFCLGILFFSATAMVFGLRAWQSHREIVEGLGEKECGTDKQR